MQDIGQLAVFLLLSAFALERIGAAVSFCIGTEPVTAAPRRLRWRTLVLFAINAGVAFAIVYANADFHILRHVQPKLPPTRFDFALTWLVLVCGSDQVRVVAAWLGGNLNAVREPKKEVAPIHIVLDDGVSVKNVA